MKLTIITGPQGSGKTTKLLDLCKNRSVIRYDNSRLNRYPMHLPGLTADIECIVFDAVINLAQLHRLAAIMDDEYVLFKLTSPGTLDSRINLDIVITTQIEKKKLVPLFKGINNINFRELKPL